MDRVRVALIFFFIATTVACGSIDRQVNRLDNSMKLYCSAQSCLDNPSDAAEATKVFRERFLKVCGYTCKSLPIIKETIRYTFADILTMAGTNANAVAYAVATPHREDGFLHSIVFKRSWWKIPITIKNVETYEQSTIQYYYDAQRYEIVAHEMFHTYFIVNHRDDNPDALMAPYIDNKYLTFEEIDQLIRDEIYYYKKGGKYK